MNKSEQKHAMLNKPDGCNKPFFYPNSMLSSNSEHADKGYGVVYYYNLFYNMMMVQSDRARLQADSITKDPVLAGLIAEQIMKIGVSSQELGARGCSLYSNCSPLTSACHVPSIINSVGGKG